MRVELIAASQNVEQALWDWRGIEEGAKLQETPQLWPQFLDRRGPCRGEADVVIVADETLVEPLEHGPARLAP